MHATLLSTHCLTTGPAHQAFTALCRWRGHVYCAWRTALHHGIVPAGQVTVRQLHGDTPHVSPVPRGNRDITLAHPTGDVRDPRLISTDEALWCFVGVYLPVAYHGRPAVLLPMASDNVLQTHVAWTTDGVTWTPLVPILRPNHWGWGIVYRQNPGDWFVTAYQAGTAHDLATTLTLATGTTPLQLQYAGTIYDGANVETDGDTSRYPHYLPAEPVLWQPAPATLACLVRTESTMDLGIATAPTYTNWRWHHTWEIFHASAARPMLHGTLLAGRAVRDQVLPAQHHTNKATPKTTSWRTALHWLPPGSYTPQHLLTLPSSGDTGYADLCAGPEPDTILVSYYTTPQGSGLPGAEVRLAYVRGTE